MSDETTPIDEDQESGGHAATESATSQGSWLRRPRTWLTVVIAAAIVAAAGLIWAGPLSPPDDPRAEGALPDRINYGSTADDWTPHGSLAGDAGFIRDMADKLPGGDERAYYVLWAGHGSYGADGEDDFALFVTHANPGGYRSVLELYLTRKDPSAKSDDGVYTFEEQAGSFTNTIIGLPLEEVEGFPTDATTEFYLLRDDVVASSVQGVMGSTPPHQHNGVIATDEDTFGDDTPFVFTMSTTEDGAVYTSPAVTDPLSADDWTKKQAGLALSQFPSGSHSYSRPPLAADGALATLGIPGKVRFGDKVGFVVTTLDNNIEVYKSIDPPNPHRQRSGVIIHEPGRDPVIAGPSVDGEGIEDNVPTNVDPLDVDYAVAVPDGLSVRHAVAVSGGTVRVAPDLPVIATPVDPGGPTIFGPAPQNTAVINFDGKTPVRTSLVKQDRER